MDRLEKSTSNDNEGFIKTVFPFDEGQKGTLLNILQYSVLAIIPIIILLKLIKEYIPEFFIGRLKSHRNKLTTRHDNRH